MIRNLLKRLRRRSRRHEARPCYRPRLELLEDRLAPATLPPGFTESLVASGLQSPTMLEFAPDGRIFITEQTGTVRVVRNGSLLPAPFLTLPNVNVDEERGLISLTFDPNFSTNHYVYVFYTANVPGDIVNRVSRFTANGDTVVPGSETVIWSMPSGAYHIAGTLHFGPDGKLYISSGDIGAGSNAQSLANPYGKILRINPDGSIPTDNPFYSQTTGTNRAIWALGLRNPFKFALQPGTGRLLISDVGGDAWEEIDDGIAGSNYGWPNSEGIRQPRDPRTTLGIYRDPLHAYDHRNGCAVTGGAFYNPPAAQFPSSYVGKYFFTDLCGGWIRLLDPATRAVSDFASDLNVPVDLRVGPDGALYYLLRGNGGQVWKIEHPSAALPPSITQQPANLTVPSGAAATFRVFATGSTPLSYQWQRNGVGIPGATASSYTLSPATLADSGATFRVVVANALGSVTSSAATLTVTPNQPPVPTIISPAEGTLYRAGEVIAYSGTAADADDGTLGPGAFTWQIDFHHHDHVHPFLAPTSGITSGTFTPPTVFETDADVFFRITLTVRDSVGVTATVTRDVLPRTTTLTFQTDPPDLQFTLEGQPRTAPLAVRGVAGIRRTLDAPREQTLNGVAYEFDHWSDGGTRTHFLPTPDSDTTYTAVYRVRTGDALVGRARATGELWVASPTGSNFASQVWGIWNPAVAWADVQVGRFNDDSLEDVVGRDPRSGQWWVAVSNGSGFTNQLWGGWSPAVGWVDVRVGDFNGDGRDDLAGRDRRTGQWWVARSTGAGFVNELWGGWNPRVTWADVRVGDFNGDGMDDLAGRYKKNGGWWVALSTGSAFGKANWTKWSPKVSWVDVQVGDFNGDGRDDLAGRDRKSGKWWVALSTGARFTDQVWAGWAPRVAWVDVRVGDFNGDGRDDLAGRKRADGSWLVAVSTGSGFTGQPWGTWSPAAGWVDVQVGDFNNDGKDDVAGRQAATGDWLVGLSSGSAFSTQTWGGWPASQTWADVRSTRHG
jgi:glucose/arabinose dehydrogenase